MTEILDTVKVSLAERRENDAWLDFSLRELREGTVYYYRVKDFLSGMWLFKICADREIGKVVVKAVKCPPGKTYAQVEGDTMVFQPSSRSGYNYDLISTPYVDENGRLRRRRVKNLGEIPELIRQNFQVATHEEATGKVSPLAGLYVTLTPNNDFRSLLILFLLQRVWPVSPKPAQIAFDEFKHKESKATSIELSPREISVLKAIRRLERVDLREVYLLMDAMNFSKEEALTTLRRLEEAGRVFQPEVGYLKTGRCQSLSRTPP